MAELKPIIAELKGRGLFIRACISTAFYCPYEGKFQKPTPLLSVRHLRMLEWMN